jgi:hypothetical protein
MSEERNPAITFGSQMGDMNVAEIIQPLLIELRKLLKTHCHNRYSQVIHEFAPIARIDGDIWAWNFEGCQKLRINRKEKYITVDIGVPRWAWENKTENEIKTYLLNGLKEAIDLMISRLKKERIEVDELKLYHDLTLVEKEYLGM